MMQERESLQKGEEEKRDLTMLLVVCVAKAESLEPLFGDKNARTKDAAPAAAVAATTLPVLTLCVLL